MQKQLNPITSQGHALPVDGASFVEDSLALQESDFTNPLISQYIDFLTKKVASGTPDVKIKRFISQAIWPRLVALRIRTVLVTLLSVIHLTNHECILDGLNHVQLSLEFLGWVLHVVRLFINILRLLIVCLSSERVSSSNKKLTWQIHLKAELTRSWMELGNDLLWVVATLTPSTYFAVSVALMLIDFAWIMYCGYAELARLNHFKNGFESMMDFRDILTQELTVIVACQDNLQRSLAYTQKKFILSVITTISTTTLAFLRIAILPTLLPALAINPVLLLGFALLSLLITLASHFIGEWLKRERPPEKIAALEKNASLATAPRSTFFKPSNDNAFVFLSSEENTFHKLMALS